MRSTNRNGSSPLEDSQMNELLLNQRIICALSENGRKPTTQQNQLTMTVVLNQPKNLHFRRRCFLCHPVFRR